MEPQPLHEMSVLGEDGKPSRVGDYELLEKIGRGAMGVVYKARHISLDRTVALKMVAESELDEDKVAASLEHPNIVPVYEVGEHEEWHYFTMKLMEGGSLAERMEYFHGRPLPEAARLLETIARAVHYGHQRGILHRDLKPANLLLDAAGVPHVADFGVAKALGKEDGIAQTDWVVGTLGYMAPEQANPRGQPLTVAADIYSLGSILYELLTGRLPFAAGSAQPQAPRMLEPSISHDLEAICLKCLEKEPGRRYGSAAELADDLQRYLKGEPVKARPRGWVARAWMWSLRHPLVAGPLATLLGVLVVAAVGSVRIANALEDDLRDEALRVNVYAARFVAQAVLFELTRYSQEVERAAEEPELVAALQAHDRHALESFLQRRFTYHAPRDGSLRSPAADVAFVRSYVEDTTSRTMAHSPTPKHPFVDVGFEWRDYFQGASQLAAEGKQTAYVSRAIKATGGGEGSFVISVPVYGAEGEWIGVLGATIASGSTLGSLRLDDRSDSHRTITLVVLADRDAADAALPGRDVYKVLFHEGLGRGMPVTLDPQTARQLAEALPEPAPHGQDQFLPSTFPGKRLEGYRDPVSGEPGKWLAAFAPVGRTGFVVIVQTRENAVLAVNAELARRIASWAVSIVLGASLLWFALGWPRYRSSRRSMR